MKTKNTKEFFLSTERLQLRDFKSTDLDIFLSYRSDPVLCEFQDFTIHSHEEAIDFLRQQENIKIGNTENWKQIAISNHSGQLLGDCAFKCKHEEARLAEIGITIRKEYHNQGIAYEALNALLEYAFKNLKIHKILAVVDIRNTASQKNSRPPCSVFHCQ